MTGQLHISWAVMDEYRTFGQIIIVKVKSKQLDDKFIRVTLCKPQIPYEMPWDGIRAFATRVAVFVGIPAAGFRFKLRIDIGRRTQCQVNATRFHCFRSYVTALMKSTVFEKEPG